MPKLRIALILPGLGRVRRGAETSFLEIARALSRIPSLDIELFGSGNDGPQGIPLHQVKCLPRERFERWPKVPCLRTETHYEELLFTLSLLSRGAYQPERFDAVIACTYPFLNWFLQWAGGRSRPKQIFVTQNGDWMCQASSREYRFFRCDGLVCINPTYFERHHRRYASTLIPNGVDPSNFRPRRPDDPHSDPQWPTDRPIILMISALIPSKNVAGGIRAVANLRDAVLVVAGDGPERAAIAELAARLLPGRHHLLGSVEPARIPELYRQADAFLHMSVEEPFGIVYLEAAASGLPIVAPDVEVPRWILGDSAVYADAGDANSVSRALEQALSPEARTTIGTAARARILKDWTWDIQAAKYHEFIESIVAGVDRRS